MDKIELDPKALETACQNYMTVTGERVDEHLEEAISDAIRAYLAATASEPVASGMYGDFTPIKVAASTVFTTPPAAPTAIDVDQILDVAGDYMNIQYGNTALHHPIDRERIKKALASLKATRETA